MTKSGSCIHFAGCEKQLQNDAEHHQGSWVIHRRFKFDDAFDLFGNGVAQLLEKGECWSSIRGAKTGADEKSAAKRKLRRHTEIKSAKLIRCDQIKQATNDE